MLLCVSASHKTAPFDMLERLSIPHAPIAERIAEADASVRGIVIVATCNRFEAYLDVASADHGPSLADAVLRAIESATGLSRAETGDSFRLIRGQEVAEHLFAVAAGLESVVVGEGEIAGQVRRALTDARAEGTTSTELERLFQRASQTQRDVKNTTALGRAGRSLVRLALQLADSRVTDWARLRVLLVGTGSYAAATVAALRDRGAADITVHSPSGRGETFATRHGLAWADREAYPHAARTADLIITCTNAPGVVLDADLLESGPATLAEPHRSRLVIDLGLPRNVSADVADLPGVALLDLETIRLHAPLEEVQAADAARALVADAARRFAIVGERRSLTPAVVALRSHAFAILEEEIDRARARGDDGRSEQAMRHLLGRLLHTPTARAHQLADAGRADDYLAALEAVFGIRVEEADLPGIADDLAV